jgi:epoxyqueuosine reductase
LPPESLTAALKAEASRLGFALAGACPAISPPRLDSFFDWLAAGYAGQMSYFADRKDAYGDPQQVMEGVRSILMLGLAYRTDSPQTPGPADGRVSRYAWGDDYHEISRQRLRALGEFHCQLTPAARVRGVVDTAPLLEREFAQLAGLGWVGKNTLILNQRFGSWFFLAALLTSEVLAYDRPAFEDHCGTCRACLDACPTGALVAPYQLDARRCISYLTIELREQVPAELRPALGDWLFGCDVCQDVCPWNRHSDFQGDAAFVPGPGKNPMALAELFALDDAAFRQRYRATPLWRAKRRGLLRNAALVLGAKRRHESFPGEVSAASGDARPEMAPDSVSRRALLRGLEDREPLVRGACAWALGQRREADAAEGLRARLAVEEDAAVRCEIEAALRFLDPLRSA